MAIKVLEIDLSEEIVPIETTYSYERAYILVRYRRQPVGWVILKDFWGPVVYPEQLRRAIAEQLGWDILQVVLGQQLLPTPSDRVPSSPISVVVCTRDRTDQLRGCLQALLNLKYPDYEIMVVDNAPRNDETAQLVAGYPIRYVREEYPGLDRARNRGIAESRHGIIAFTDDDGRPDRYWLDAIASAFAQRDVKAVTGPVAPAELETDAQILFELSYGGMNHGFHHRVVRRRTLTEKELLWSSAFGVGVNMAFRRELFSSIGLFDIALDAGTPSRGAGDIEMFHRLVAQGCTLIYEPSALVWHIHRRDPAALRQQLFDNGRGFASYLMSCARDRTICQRSILYFAVREWFFGWIIRRLLRPGFLPRRLIMAELAGMLSGLLASSLPDGE